MYDCSFDYIWDNIVVPLTQELSEYIKKKDACANIRANVSTQDKEALKNLYNQARDELKLLYHYNTGEDCKIDIHKVAACFASVIMQYQIIEFEIDENTTDDMYLSNARLAYSVSLAIIKDHLIYKYQDHPDILTELLEKNLRMPETSDGHDEFSLGRIKTLMLNDIFLGKFDVLSYSDMLFWVELFNIMILENKCVVDYVWEP
jgi:hypothetical protein